MAGPLFPGAQNVATCVDCHTAHWVLPKRDPASTVNQRNVTETCRQCHPDATAEFAESYTHQTASLASNPLVSWVTTAYILLIVVVIGGMAVHNGIILNYYMVEKKRAEQAVPGFLRMDKIQIVQHIALAVSFIGLVITGFALAFPAFLVGGAVGPRGNDRGRTLDDPPGAWLFR